MHLIGFQKSKTCILSEFGYFYYPCINHLEKSMIEERIILQVLAEQRDEIAGYNPAGWVSRREESIFEFDSTWVKKLGLENRRFHLRESESLSVLAK